MTPEPNPQNLGTGIVGPRGELLPCYYAVQEVIREVQAFQSLYMNFEWEATMTVGASGNGTYRLLTDAAEEVRGIKKTEATEDAIIGQFRDGSGNTAYMVVNYASPFDNASNTVTLQFERASRVLVCMKGRRVVKELTGKTLTLEMGSGEGYFVIPVA